LILVTLFSRLEISGRKIEILPSYDMLISIGGANGGTDR